MTGPVPVRDRILLPALLLVAAGLAVARALLGDLVIPVRDALAILGGAEIPGASYILMESTLPRAVLGLLAGFAFGIAGALFQTVLRNPLASPDIIGVGMGASASAVIAIVGFGLTGMDLSLAAIVGALAVAILIRVLAGRSGEHLVLTGVGMAAVLAAVIQYLFTRADVWDAQLVLRWLTGSVSQADWGTVRWLGIALLVAGLGLWVLARDLPAVELGDDLARGLGSHRNVNDRLLALGVVVVALGVAAVGPMAFVAFLSGPIARALNRGRATLLGAGLVGAIVVVAADLAGDRVISTVNLPAGVVTGLAGAPVLLWLLHRGRHERSLP